MARQDDDIGMMIGAILIFSLIVGVAVLISYNQNKSLSIAESSDHYIEEDIFPIEITEQCWNLELCTSILWEKEGMTLEDLEGLGYRIWCKDDYTCWVDYHPIHPVG